MSVKRVRLRRQTKLYGTLCREQDNIHQRRQDPPTSFSNGIQAVLVQKDPLVGTGQRRWPDTVYSWTAKYIRLLMSDDIARCVDGMPVEVQSVSACCHVCALAHFVCRAVCLDNLQPMQPIQPRQSRKHERQPPVDASEGPFSVPCTLERNCYPTLPQQ